MQFTSTLSIAACLALVSALPAIKRTGSTEITFIGAAGAQYSLTVPLDGSTVLTNNALSISSISSSIDIPSQCHLKTVDFPPALVEVAPGLWQVGPPETILSIACTSVGPPPPTTITIEFNGAADAKYFLTVPLDGSVVPTNNVLSISTLVSTYDVADKCVFTHIDNVDTRLVSIAANTWALGPPQTIINVACH